MSKGTINFKKAIRDGLERQAVLDPLFAEKLKNPKKTLDECVKYILSEVQKSKRSGWTDDEVFALAFHYYDEPDVKASGNPKVQSIVINSPVQLTEEEIAEAKEKALKEVIAAEKKRLTTRKKPEKKTEKKDDDKKTGTLF